MDYLKHTITACYRPLFYLLIVLYLASCGVSRNATTQPQPPTTTSTKQQDLIDFSMRFLGRPYRSAGKGPNNFDCSGFTSFVFREFGYNLASNSAAQDRQFPSIDRKADLQIGDLVFFEGRARNRRVGHVGIVTETRSNGDFRFIHAAVTGGVIISSSTEAYYSVRYLRGGRVLKNDPNYASRPKTVPDNPQPPARANQNRRARNNNNQNNSFTPAPPTQREPVVLRAANVSPQRNEPLISTNEQLANISANTDEPRILVQTDPSKNPALADNRTANNEERPPITFINTDIIRREDNLVVPDPVVARVEVNERQQTHTVKSGETLFSISRQYNTTVEQLRQWNPQMGNVLRTGEVLTIRN
jgi:LysM repeat protein